mmetsp:Transcript_1202/g.2844  ORF Transcript_1202/g.2844 Transcript_1202/m.2844 type:complete len:286 (+) Transcript_1202:723-1580(+)
MEHLGAALQRRCLVVPRARPLPVQVGARCIGAEMAPERSVGVHTRHNVESDLAQKLPHEPVPPLAKPDEPVQQTLSEPLSHRLPRVLPVDHPRLQRPRPHRHEIHRAPIERLPNGAHRRALGGAARGHEVLVPLVRVGRKVSKVNHVLLRLQPPVERAFLGVVLGVGAAAPVVPVVRVAHRVAPEGESVGALARVGDREAAVPPRERPARAEVEPLLVLRLLKLRVRVIPDVDAHVAAAARVDHLDVARIESARDVHRHATPTAHPRHAHVLLKPVPHPPGEGRR